MNNQNVIYELIMVTYDIGPSLSPFVAKVIKEIKKDEKVKHILTPMGSVLEVKWKDVMALIDQLFQKFSPEYERLGITLKIDYRQSKQDRIAGKIRSVEKKLNIINI